MFDTVIHLPWDAFPFPSAVGVEYLSAMAGKGMLYALAFFLAAWGLDAATEAIRGRFGASRRGRYAYFAVSSVLLAATVVGLFHVWVWPRFPVIRYVAQGTKNLALQEVGIAMLSSVLLSMGLCCVVSRLAAPIRKGTGEGKEGPLREGAPAQSAGGGERGAAAGERTRLLRFFLVLLALVPPSLAAFFCYRQYGVFPPRVRSFDLAWRECIALFALEAVFLAAVARPVWRRRASPIRGGHWKRFVPRAAWLVCFGFWLHGVDSVREVPRLARISAGAESCGPVKGPQCRLVPTCAAVPFRGCAISEAIAAAPAGAVIDVPAGVYAPISTGGKAITLRAIDGPERTVIDASLLRAEGITNRCATLVSEGQAARLERLVARVQRAHVLQLPILLPKMGEGREPAPPHPGGASRLVGFTLRGGHADCGGGAFGGTLEDCVLEGNLSEFCGGGAFGSRLVRCMVRGNAAAWMGGGVWGGSTEDCTITGNASEDFGGGVWGGVHAGLSATGNHARHHPDTAATATQ